MDGCIVMRCGLKSFDGEMFAHGSWNLACAKHFQNVNIICGVTNECHSLMVFRRGADEGHATDVDVFYGVSVGDIWFGNRLFKWIKIDRDKVNIVPTKIEQLLMIFVGGTGKESAVDGRVESLDSSAKDFGRFGLVRNFGDGKSIVTQKFGGPARGKQSPAEISKRFGKFDHSSFIVDGENSCRHEIFPFKQLWKLSRLRSRGNIFCIEIHIKISCFWIFV